MKKLRVFLAEDYALVREGLRALLGAQPEVEVVGEADEGEPAWRQARDLDPDVVVLDVSLPVRDGVRAIERLKQIWPQARVLALTAPEDRVRLCRLLRAGASGCLLKLASGAEFLRAVRTVAEGGVYLDPRLDGPVVKDFTGGKDPAEAAAGPHLARREMEVLRLLAYGYSGKEIAARLGVSVKTVETHKVRAMEKLSLDSRADVVRFALGHGWFQPA